jgi:anti-sigma B factor antagonist
MATDPGGVVLQTRIERHEGVAVVVATGELDVATAPRLLDEVRRANADGPPGPVVLDAAGVGFMDSSGLRALLDAERAAHEAGRPFAIARPSAGVRRVLELVDLIDQMSVLDDLSPATLARLSGPA